MSTHSLCFEQKYEKYQIFLFENFLFLVVKFSIYLNRRVFIMNFPFCWIFVIRICYKAPFLNRRSIQKQFNIEYFIMMHRYRKRYCVAFLI